MATDMKIDFDGARDFVDAADGSWVEVDDSSTAVVMQLDCEEAKWWGDPPAGSQNAEIMRSDLPTIEAIQDSSKRALTQLVRAGLITDLTLSIGDATSGQLGLGELDLAWRDRATSRPADIAYSPLGGHP